MGVLIHQGEATSGHYFSYIRDRATGQWNEFNDSTITPFDPANLQPACFGGTVENREKNIWGASEHNDCAVNAAGNSSSRLPAFCRSC